MIATVAPVIVAPASVSVTVTRGIDRRRGRVLGVRREPADASTTGASLTHVTVIDTVAIEPPVSVYVNVSGDVPGGLLQ